MEFLRSGRRGWEIVYHQGFLARDRWLFTVEEDGSVTQKPLEPENTIANMLMEAAQRREVLLFQRRVADGEWEYYARKL